MTGSEDPSVYANLVGAGLVARKPYGYLTRMLGTNGWKRKAVANDNDVAWTLLNRGLQQRTVESQPVTALDCCGGGSHPDVPGESETWSKPLPELVGQVLGLTRPTEPVFVLQEAFETESTASLTPCARLKQVNEHDRDCRISFRAADHVYFIDGRAAESSVSARGYSVFFLFKSGIDCKRFS